MDRNSSTSQLQKDCMIKVTYFGWLNSVTIFFGNYNHTWLSLRVSQWEPMRVVFLLDENHQSGQTLGIKARNQIEIARTWSPSLFVFPLSSHLLLPCHHPPLCHPEWFLCVISLPMPCLSRLQLLVHITQYIKVTGLCWAGTSIFYILHSTLILPVSRRGE